MTHPLDLAFAIDPPLDWLGRPWHARLLRARESARLAPVVFDGAVDAAGRFKVRGQAAGLFNVSIADSLGNRLPRRRPVGPGRRNATPALSPGATLTLKP